MSEAYETERWNLLNHFGYGAFQDGLTAKRITEIDGLLERGDPSRLRQDGINDDAKGN